MAPALIGCLILAVGMALLIHANPVTERARSAVFDTFQRIAPRQRRLKPVVVVDVDDESLRRLGQWPWSRQIVARLVDGLTESGVAAVAFDMVFSEPDRTSPALLVPQWENSFQLGRTNRTAPLPDYDADLARAFQRGRVVAAFGLSPMPVGPLPDELPSIATIGGDPTSTLVRFGGAVRNLPILDEAAAGHGTFTVPNENDQVIRRVPLIMAVGNRIVPSFNLELLRVMQDEDTIRIRTETVGGVVSGYTVRVGDIDLPLDAAGYFWLHHPDARSTPTVPAWKVIDPAERAALRDQLKGTAALIGTSAVGLVDLRATPLAAFEPGVNINASVVEQAIDGRFLVRPIWADRVEHLAAAFGGAAMILLVCLGWSRTAWVTGWLSGGLACVATFVLFRDKGWLFDPLPFAAITLTVLVATSLAHYAVANRSARRLRKAFAHYLSPDLVDVLANRPDSLKLGGESREMTFLFTDLEGFTSLTELWGAEALVTLLNTYLDNLCRIAMDHGGTVDKIVGDAMHVMFNAPLDQPDHAERAVTCALAIDAFSTAFAAEQRQKGIVFGATRIGINTGRAVVGNFGGSRRFDYTAHGDAINTAARLETANKAIGTRICVAQTTVQQTSGHVFRFVGTLMLKGKSSGVEVSEPVTGDEALAVAEAYNAAFLRFARGEDLGGLDLARLRAEHPDDPLLRLHTDRISAGLRSTSIAA